MAEFARRLLAWYRRHGRHDLPWQRDPTPYRVWISEIMLQQTQVATVISYFERFTTRFPDVHALAAAELDEVLHLWSGLGYYARARHLHRAARRIRDEHDGRFPEQLETLMALPGIGRSTAGAILALSLDRPFPILDGNARRVLARFHAVHGHPGQKAFLDTLWVHAAEHVPRKRAAAYTQAIMDLGATICIRGQPRCDQCPVEAQCEARRAGLETALPERRTRQAPPVRQSTFVIIENSDGAVLLERRPPSGIWGGLWSLPECPPGEDLDAWLARRYGWRFDSARSLPGFRHTFTHFHLDITPVRLRLARDAAGVREDGDTAWVRPGDENGYGLAAPVKKLINDIWRNHQEATDDENGELRKTRQRDGRAQGAALSRRAGQTDL